MIAGARVAFVVDGAIEQRTGGYLYDKIVIERLRAAGAEVRVVSLEVGQPRALVAGNARAYAALTSTREDVVVIDELCHPRATVAAWLARAARSRAHRPRVVTLVHHLAACERRGLARAGRLAVERALLAASDRVVATSETTAELLRRLGVGGAFVARPGRDRLGNAEAPPAPATPTRFLFLGALTRRKDPMAALGAFARVQGAARLTFVGPTDRDPRIAGEVERSARALGDRVRIAGELDDADVARALREHDVLVMPSRYEGYGIAAAEALAHGLMVVAARAGALPEVVREEHGGVLVPLGDVDALADAMQRATKDRVWLEAQKHRALAGARSLATWADTVQAFSRAALGP